MAKEKPGGSPKEHRVPTEPDKIIKALTSDEIQKIYSNGFAVAHSNSDVSIILQQHATPVGVVNMSFTLAKSLAQRLSEMINDIENRTGTPVLSTFEIDAASEEKRTDK